MANYTLSELKEPWHTKSGEETLRLFDANPAKGLSSREAADRLQKFGRNITPLKKKEFWIIELFEPFTEPMMILLIIVGVIYGFLGELRDTLAIFAIIIVIGGVESVQENRTERSLRALKNLTAPKALVVREGQEMQINAEEIVQGDIILLSRENRVPADLRLIESTHLEIDESMLTGESIPSEKDAGLVLGEKVPLAERKNMAYSGTLVTRGRGVGVAIATGSKSSLGKLASSTLAIKRESAPIQSTIQRFTFQLAVLSVLTAAAVVVIGVLRGQPAVEMALTGLTLAIATIPEDLPILLAVILLASVWRMARKSALSRSLYAPEVLGTTTVICTDKTGTLTQNKLTLVRAFTMKQGLVKLDDPSKKNENKLLRFLIECAVRSSEYTAAKDLSRVDPIDRAIVQVANKIGVQTKPEAFGLQLIGQLPFEEKKKLASVTYLSKTGNRVTYAKGAPENVIKLCTTVVISDQYKPSALSEEEKDELLKTASTLSEEGLRVLAVATTTSNPALEEYSDEGDFSFAGLIAMRDIPRPDVGRALELCRSAGIRVIMLTGDHPNTALSIARETGLTANFEVATGPQIDPMSEEELADLVRRVDIYARLEPTQKLRIVRALKKKLNEVIAVTGDGANDAPSLKQADVGVAMGQRGTDVAKEASSMIIADDNFNTIVEAVEEGRRGYGNLRSGLRYYLSIKTALLLIIFVSTLAGFAPALAPIQLVFQEVFGDVTATTTFASEPAEKDLMKLPPRKKNEQLIDGSVTSFILIQGISMFLGVFAVYAFSDFSVPQKAQTAAFATFMMALVLLSFSTRRISRNVSFRDLFANRYLDLVSILTMIATLLVIYLPGLQPALRTVSLTVSEFGIAFIVAAISVSWYAILSKLLKSLC